MFGRSVGIVATCALGASAFILPPGIAPASHGEAPDLSLSLVNPKSQSIHLPCPECVFPTKQEDSSQDDGLFRIQGGAQDVVLNFLVSDDGERLLLNNEVVYPLNKLGGTVYVEQIPAGAGELLSEKTASTLLEVTGSAITIDEEKPASDQGDVVVPMQYRIVSLEGQGMTLERVAVNLLKSGNGELLILDVHSLPNSDVDLNFKDQPFGPPIPPPGHAGHRHHKPPGCNALPAPLCRLKHMIEAKFQSMRPGPPGRKGGCPGRNKAGDDPPHPPPHHIRPHFDGPGPEHPHSPHHGRPHHMRPHHNHHFRHNFLHAFLKGFVAVLVPVAAGVVVGLTVSLVGLVVGRLIGFLWIKLARGGRRGSASVALEETAGAGEHDGLIAEMEAPPVYENAPAYEESESEKERK